jgi:hypothetical protein
MNFKLSKYLLALCLVVGFASCSEDDRIDPIVGDTVTVELNVPSTNSLSMVTRGMSDAEEKQIGNIHVLEFNGTNLVKITPRTVSGTSFTLSVTSGVDKLVVLANVDAATIAGIAVGQTHSAVQSALKVSLADATTGWDTSTPVLIPMWGESTAITSSITIDLLRMLARVNLEVKTSNFELTSISLYNTNQSGLVIPDGPTTVTVDPSATKSNKIEYGSLLVVADAMTNEIYTFETSKGTGAVADPCIIVGGIYGSDATPTYYRLNFHGGLPTPAHLDIKRNHSYNFEITNVLNNGYSTELDAYNARPINIVYDVIIWDDSDFNDFVIDGQYYLTVNKSVWELPEAGVLTNDDTYKIIVKTDYPGALAVDVTSASSWLTIDNIGGGNIYIKATDNTGGNLRTGTITIKAGRLVKVIHITQIGVATFTSHSAWAGSNIYWNGTTLTFDDTPADPANPTSADEANWRKQGVYFQWGSLWGLDPSGPASWSGVVYVPSGSGYTQTTVLASDYVSGMPRVSDSENLGDNRTRAYLYEITNGSTGIGDICKYLTEIGSAPGGKKWRMPTSIEFGPGWEEYRLVAFNNAANDGNRYHYYTEPATSTYYTSDKSGRAPILEGTYKVETANDPTSARTFFPASGGRWNVSSGLDRAGDYGLYLSSSAKDALGRGMGFSVIGGGNGRMSPDNGNIRQYCFPVRCVAE